MTFLSSIRSEPLIWQWPSIIKVDYWNLYDLHKFLIFEPESYLKYFHPHEFDMASLLKELETGDYFCLLYWRYSPIGYGMLRGWSQGYEIPSLGIAISHVHQHKGLGNYMMAHLELTARMNNAEKLRLVVAKENENAIKLYTKRGYIFNEHGEFELEGFKTLGEENKDGHSN
jgi:ribosomal protein S18 acetylase RimI-like enzyme